MMRNERNVIARTALALLVPAFAIVSVAAQINTLVVPRRILFIGDSFTYFQNGIYTHFEKLAAAANPPLAVTTDKSAFGGAFLHRLWDLQEPVKAIDTAVYDVVVLQEDIPETTVADFREYARKFVAEVRKNHARPILFMAWAYNRLGWISMAEICAGASRRCKGVECGCGSGRSGLAGRVETAARNGDPSGFAYAPPGITAEEALSCRKSPWQTVQNYRAARI